MHQIQRIKFDSFFFVFVWQNHRSWQQSWRHAKKYCRHHIHARQPTPVRYLHSVACSTFSRPPPQNRHHRDCEAQASAMAVWICRTFRPPHYHCRTQMVPKNQFYPIQWQRMLYLISVFTWSRDSGICARIVFVHIYRANEAIAALIYEASNILKLRNSIYFVE